MVFVRGRKFLHHLSELGPLRLYTESRVSGRSWGGLDTLEVMGLHLSWNLDPDTHKHWTDRHGENNCLVWSPPPSGSRGQASRESTGSAVLVWA